MGIDATNLSKLRWRCRRGMRELDEAMVTYLEHHYQSAPEDERLKFVELQDMQDPELFQLISGKVKEARYQNILDKMSATMASRT